jgi:hypothetical protein
VQEVFDPPVASDAAGDQFHLLGRQGGDVPAGLSGSLPSTNRRRFDPDQGFQLGPFQELLSGEVGNRADGGGLFRAA